MAAEKRDWKKLVAESGGTMIFLPDQFLKAAQEVESLRQDFNKEVARMAEKEIGMQVKSNTVFYELRKYLAKNGMPEVWLKMTGWNSDALNEGVFIVNISEK